MKVAAPHITNQITMGNALFWQPTPWCARSCPGCYTKEIDSNKGIFINTLLRELSAKKENFVFNQMTMAVDKLPKAEAADNHFHQRVVMKMALEYFLRLSRASEVADEFHITVHTLQDLLDYDFANNTWNLDVISISELTLESAIEAKKNIKHLNWNLTVWNPLAAVNYKNVMRSILEVVDSCYLVLHKPDTGLEVSGNSWVAHKEMVKFVNELPAHLKEKVNIDGCVKDAEKFNLTGRGCSSNISRFHVWPDGSVTGCPYNQKRLTGPASSIEQLQVNIATVNKIYEFNTCKIPDRLSKTGHEFIIIED